MSALSTMAKKTRFLPEGLGQYFVACTMIILENLNINAKSQLNDFYCAVEDTLIKVNDECIYLDSMWLGLRHCYPHLLVYSEKKPQKRSLNQTDYHSGPWGTQFADQMAQACWLAATSADRSRFRFPADGRVCRRPLLLLQSCFPAALQKSLIEPASSCQQKS